MARAEAEDDVLAKVVDVDIPAQALTSAVIELSRQSGTQILMSADVVGDLVTQGVRGTMSLRQALTELLKGTSLGFHPAGANTIGIDPASASFEEPFATTVAEEPPPVSPSGEEIAPDPEQPLDTIPVQSTVAEEPLPVSPSGDATVLDPIVVTAGKRIQDIRTVPGSVTALGGDDLERRNAQGMEDYLKLVPGATLSRGEVDNSFPVIRGISTSSAGGQTPWPVGTYVDEVPFGDLFLPTSITDMHPFDLERVEVLKGPQGTLFGSGSLAGAIRFITRKPEMLVWQSKVMGMYTTTKEGGSEPTGAAMLNVPIGGAAALRMTGLYRESPGYIDQPNLGEEDVNKVKQSHVRAIADWRPTDRLDLSLTYLRQDSQQASESFADQVERLERNTTPQPTPRESTFDVANLVASYDFDWGTLLSSSSRKTKEIFNLSDLSRNRGSGSSTEDPGAEDQQQAQSELPLWVDIEGLLQEVRLASPEDFGAWQWLVGIAYQRDDAHFLNMEPQPLADQTGETPPQAQSQFIQIDAKATEEAVFGEVTRRLGERWEVTAGARYFRTRLVADTFFTGAVLIAVSGEPESRGRSIVEEQGVNPKFSVNFLMNPNISVYAQAAKGFQFGGIQILPATVTTETIAESGGESGFVPYQSSDLWNYEIGARTDWFGHRLQLDATVFYMDWKDLQLTQTDANRVFSFVANIAAAHSAGIELALQATPFTGMRWLSSAALMEPVTDERYESPSGPVEEGTLLPGAAKFTMANVVSYELPFSLLGFTPGASLTHTHTGRRFNDLNHSREMAGYDLLDARLHLIGSGFRLAPDLSLGVNNLLDTRAVSSINDRSRTDDVWFVRPRTAVLSLTLGLF